MRIALHIDGATESELRRVAKLLNEAGLSGQLEVGLDGPERWTARTPKMVAGQYDIVLPRLA